MLVYLDNGENIKSHPNENFGRELLELFTMGVGNYSERDVREAARAFTGWTNDVLQFKFDAAQHDAGAKTFLGKTGALDGEDIVDTILAQPVTAEFITAKVYRFLVRDEIAPAVRAELARTYRDERLRPEAAAEADLPVEGLLQPGVGGRADQEPGPARRLDLPEDGAARDPDDPRLRPHDGRRSASRCSSRRTWRVGRAAARGSRRPRCSTAAT